MFDTYNHLLSTMPFQVSIKNTAVTDSDLASSDEFLTLVGLLLVAAEEAEEEASEAF